MIYFSKKIKFVITIFVIFLITFSFVQTVEADTLPLFPPETDSEPIEPQTETGSKEGIFTPQIGIGGDFQVGTKIEVSGRTFAKYIVTIYNWSLRALVILVIVMIMVGGIQWMSAAGNAAIVTQARNRIMSSLIGLLIGIGSYTLLNFINPELVQLRDFDAYNLNDQIETSHFDVGVSTVNQCGRGLDLIVFDDITGKYSPLAPGSASRMVYTIKTNACYPDLKGCTKKYINIPKEIPDLKMEDIDYILVSMGVNSNAHPFCDIRVLSILQFKIKTMSSDNNWYAVIVDGAPDGGGFGCGAAQLLVKYGASIKIRACGGEESECSDLDYHAGSDDLLKGFSLILTDQSLIGKGAFFYYEYIDIYTNISCIVK